MNKIVALILVLLIGSSIGTYVYKKNKNSKKVEPQVQQQTSTVQSKVETPSNVKTYTMEEVVAHGSSPDSNDCWTVIHDKVYDIAEFIYKHPGGEQIAQVCGKDGTVLFETRPMGSKTPHSEAAREMLKKFYIGDLKK
jgi:cytochrome b involved in lipid metabolism